MSATKTADGYLGSLKKQEEPLTTINENTERDRKLTEELTKAKLDSANRVSSAMISLAKGNKSQTIAALRMSQGAATASTIAGAMKSFEKGGPAGFFLGIALLAEGMARVQQINQQIKELSSVKAAATGMSEIVSQPTMILAGEAGPESVQITPLDPGMNQNGPQGGSLTVNISGNVMSEEFVELELSEKIANAVRRGVDFGIS